jgi:hypothetical protein
VPLGVIERTRSKLVRSSKSRETGGGGRLSVEFAIGDVEGLKRPSHKTMDVVMKLQQCAVAYIDVLGFSTLVTAAAVDTNKLKTLQDLVRLLDSAVPSLNGIMSPHARRQAPKHLYISDCIVLSAPLQRSAKNDYHALSAVIARTIQLHHLFISRGFLIRGGISVGLVWHTRKNIVGPAYQKAHDTEKCVGFPAIALDDTAIARWEYEKTTFFRSQLHDFCVKYRGHTIVNGLLDYYIENANSPGKIDEAYDSYRLTAVNNVQSNTDGRILNKWRWMLDFIGSERPDGRKWQRA